MGYLLKVIGNSSYAWVNNVSCEEKGEESEELSKKNEGMEFSDDLFLHNKFASGYIQIGNFDSKHNNIFPSSDYSQEVYFPPEML